MSIQIEAISGSAPGAKAHARQRQQPRLSQVSTLRPLAPPVRHGERIPRSFLASLAKGIDAALLVFTASACLGLSGRNLLTTELIDLLPFMAIVGCGLAGLAGAQIYKVTFSRNALDHIVRVTASSGVGLAFGALIASLLASPDLARWTGLAALSGWAALVAHHAHHIALVKALMRSGRLSENAVIIGATSNARDLITRNDTTRDLNILGVFDDRVERSPQDLAGIPLLGGVDDLLAWNNLPDVDCIVVTVTSEARERVRSLINRLRVLPQKVVLLLDLDGLDPETESLASLANSPAAYISGSPANTERAAIKRVADIAFASLMLVAFAPVMLAVAAAIRLDSEGPILFRQKRLGFNNQVIRVLKFRSMVHDAASEHRIRAQTTANDPRVTRIGRFIRRTSIDELPQLVNVIRGEMSLVGPRPHAVGMSAGHLDVHAIVSDYAHRHRVKPGLTGWAQVNGSRGPVHTEEEVRERVRLDMEYVNRASFWFDLYIMLITAPRLIGDKTRDR